MSGAVHPLDDPVATSLDGVHARHARREGRVATFDPEVATFSALPGDPADGDWADLARLLGPGALADLFSHAADPPGWEQVFTIPGVQLVGPTVAPVAPTVAGTADAEVVVLGPADVPEMLDLAGRTRPGPFWTRTVELGTYLGVRDDGHLVAMAGERLRPPGWTEVSAVCTDPSARGRGHAGVLVARLVAGILDRGERPFLHVAGHNPTALAVYGRLGFVPRRDVVFRGFRTPG